MSDSGTKLLNSEFPSYARYSILYTCYLFSPSFITNKQIEGRREFSNINLGLLFSLIL